ncbi:hypothetical protein MTR_2g095250 [Medicago truncatula]|uniref:Uncharacterized protein n=1 Tax=Medicago truncatula TaxID=3880 RepID=A0A072VCT0_MEDTR|nr:hypothetical protein MTR_2g095250 [Medicago truncatula]
MGSLTYKVFNPYFSIRYGTYNSHLHTTLPLKCESIYSSCSPSSGSSCLYCSCWFLRNGPTLYCRCCFLRIRTGYFGRTIRQMGL